MRSESGALQRLKHKLIERVAVASNRYLYKHHLWWIQDQSWLDPYRDVMRYDPSLRRPQVRKLDRRFTLVEFARLTRQLEGSTAECGVARGVGSAMILITLAGTYQGNARHYAFDAFAGLPPESESDRMRDGGFAWGKGDLTHDRALAEELLAPFAHADLRIGWIPETFAGLADERFRFVHIDVDLYEPTRDSFEFFYPRLVPGGIMILDDHGLETCPGARRAALEYMAGTPDIVVDLATGQGLIIKQPGGGPGVPSADA